MNSSNIGYMWENPKRKIHRVKTQRDEFVEMLEYYAYLCETIGKQSERSKKAYSVILTKYDNAKTIN